MLTHSGFYCAPLQSWSETLGLADLHPFIPSFCSGFCCCCCFAFVFTRVDWLVLFICLDFETRSYLGAKVDVELIDSLQLAESAGLQ